MCICGSNKNFQECCGDIISGNKIAQTPEELMRSRYSAYVKADGRYLVFSSVKEHRDENEIELIEEFAKSVQWLKLVVLNAVKKSVEFKAYYKDEESIKVLHEKSNFIKEDNIWKYKDGEIYTSKVEEYETTKGNI